MPLFADRSDLSDAIKNECQRTTHAAFAAALPRFVALAEQRMWFGSHGTLECDPLRVREMETSATLTATDGAANLPASYLSTISLEWTGSPRCTPDFMAPDAFRAARYTSTSGTPVAYTVEGARMLFSPMISGDFDHLYYAMPAALEADDDTNDILETYPMIYFHGVLIEAYGWLRHDDRRAQAMGDYKSAIDALVLHSIKSRHSGNRLVPRVPGSRI